MLFPITNPFRTIPGLVAYYDARDINGRPPGNQPAVGTISNWQDTSGNNNNAAQGTGASQPSYNYSTFNTASVSFPGSRFMSVPSNSTLNVTNIHSMAVCSASSRSVGIQGIVTKNTSGGVTNCPYGFEYNNTVTTSDITLPGNNINTSISDSSINTIEYISQVYDGTANVMYLNNSTSSEAGSGSIATTTGVLSLGQQKVTFNRFLNGNIFMYCIYRTVLSQAQINLLRLYCANIWGLSLNTI